MFDWLKHIEYRIAVYIYCVFGGIIGYMNSLGGDHLNIRWIFFTLLCAVISVVVMICYGKKGTHE